MRKIAFIIPYFGKMNNYVQLWLESCAANRTIDWFLFTDDRTTYEFPNNVKIQYMTFAEMKVVVQKKFDFKIELNKPYKLCDYKPAYGYIFNEYIQGYDFWGFCDMDLIFGDIRKFITDEILDSHDKVLKHGHFTLIKNNEECNHLFRRKFTGCIDYISVFQSRHSYAFDEWGGFTTITEKSNIREYFEVIYADINICYDFFQVLFVDNGYTPQVFVWDEGTLFRYCWYDGRLHRQEFMYIHLQKRKMDVRFKYIQGTKKFYISPHEFFHDEEFCPNNKNLIKTNPFKLYYPAWARLEFKWKIEAVIDKFLEKANRI